MAEYIMKCGHPNSDTIILPDGTKIPICVICGCMNIKKEITESTEGLEGRTAICCQHKNRDCKSVPSSWDLPFFQYNPEDKHDSYYCGCWGWD